MQKKSLHLAARCFLLFSLTFFSFYTYAQGYDTLAFQDFEVMPQTPTWTYTGTPNAFLSGNSSASATPANSPVGIGGSRAWHLVQVSGGNPVSFTNQTIPTGYDTVRVRFRLAAMNLNGSGGGPDNLDYVLVEYSLDGGVTFVRRLRVRGATSNNCSWAYSATGKASAWYLPGNEVVFQPTTSGLQTTFGMSTVELEFPGTISSLMVRITPRSSSGTDHWFIDNLVLEGQRSCNPTSDSIAINECDFYVSPSGNQTFTSSGIYQDTLTNATGCDSLLTIDLTLNFSTNDTLVESVCGNYTSPGGLVFNATGIYADTISNTVGCDSILVIDLTVNSPSSDSIVETTCGSYTTPSGNSTYTVSGTYLDTLTNAGGCDSLLTIDLTVNSVDTSIIANVDTLTANASGAVYQWLDCNTNQLITGATSQQFIPTATGSYAVIVTENGCTDTSACRSVILAGMEENSLEVHLQLWPNPVQSELNLAFGEVLSDGYLQIVDLSGKVQVTRKIDHQAALQISTGQLAAGVYLLLIDAQGQQIRRKFVKQ